MLCDALSELLEIITPVTDESQGEVSMQIKKSLKKRGLRTAALLLALLTLFSVSAVRYGGLAFGAAAAGGDPVKYIRVGLYWDGRAQESADLQNERGSGFEFGYFDDDRSFVSLFETDETAVSILKDLTMSRNSADTQYQTGASGRNTVGCWHILLETCETRREAEDEAEAYSDGFTVWTGGEWLACAGSYVSEDAAQEAAAARHITGEAMTGSNRCVTVVERDTGRILFEFDDSHGRSLGVMPCGASSPVTLFAGRRYFGGFQFIRPAASNLTVVNFVTMDDYGACVAASEMSTGWPPEALKAQVVAAKSYAASNLGHHEKYGFDVCGTTECQRYIGLVSEMSDCVQAAQETSGVYITYEGDYARAFYYSSDGGATEDSENVFYEAIPYLRGKTDPYEEHVEITHRDWSFTLTGAELTRLLRTKGYACADIVGVTPVYTASGNVRSLIFTDANGVNWAVEKDGARTLINQSDEVNTYSLHYTVTDASGSVTEPTPGFTFYVNGADTKLEGAEAYALDGLEETQTVDLTGRVTVRTWKGNETIDASPAVTAGMIRADSYRFAGSGCGHNVGMSQFGAKAMAELGYSYQEILNFYYTGVTIG